jgi:hypothetical protein
VAGCSDAAGHSSFPNGIGVQRSAEDKEHFVVAAGLTLGTQSLATQVARFLALALQAFALLTLQSSLLTFR